MGKKCSHLPPLENGLLESKMWHLLLFKSRGPLSACPCKKEIKMERGLEAVLIVSSAAKCCLRLFEGRDQLDR